MDDLRSLADIQADIAAAARRLSDLEAERRHTRETRTARVVADFDAGLARSDIAARWGLAYGRVSAILYQAGRTERTRSVRGLDAAQRVDFDRLVRQGVRTRLARAIALRGPS
jgi:hypothetical protein